MFFVLLKEKDLAATFGWIQALVGSRLRKETAYVFGADPVLLAGRFDERGGVAVLIAADQAVLRHGGWCQSEVVVLYCAV